MILTSRPLRFLGVVSIGWTALRVTLLWPHVPVPDRAAATSRAAGPDIGLPPAVLWSVATGPLLLEKSIIPPSADDGASALLPRMPARAAARKTAARPDPISVALALAALVRITQEEAVGANPATAPKQDRPHASRWSGSLWAVVRQAGPAIPFAGQLGGSQAGARIAYMIDPARRIAVAGRVAGALRNRETQAAIGVEWQPMRAPIRLFAEHRIAVDGGKGGPAAGVIAGLDPVALPRGFSLQGYGQAGAIARDGGEGFADGALHLAHPVAAVGKSRVEAGLGAWGGAQRGVNRLDIGPSVAAIVPVGDQRVRLTLDWRRRVAGNARPGSGLALTLGADF